jgi:hypothetical protein
MQQDYNHRLSQDGDWFESSMTRHEASPIHFGRSRARVQFRYAEGVIMMTKNKLKRGDNRHVLP